MGGFIFYFLFFLFVCLSVCPFFSYTCSISHCSCGSETKISEVIYDFALQLPKRYISVEQVGEMKFYRLYQDLLF